MVLGFTVIAWPLMAGMCVAIGVIHLLTWIKLPQQRANLVFFLMAFSVAGLILFELQLMHAPSPEEYEHLVRWLHIPSYLFFISLVLFVRVYFNAGRLWLAWSIGVLRSATVIINFTVDPNIHFIDITRLQPVQLWGETLFVPEGIPSPWQLVAHASVLLTVVYCVDAVLTVWKRGDATERRRALYVGGSILLCLGFSLTMVVSNLWFGTGKPFYLFGSFTLVVLAASNELGSDSLRALTMSRSLQAANSELHKSQQYMNLLSEAAAIGMWQWDADSDNIWMTDQTRAIYGFEAAERVNLQRFLEAVHDLDLAEVSSDVNQSLRGGERFLREYRIVLPDGRTRWVATRGGVELGSEGQPTVMLGVTIDVSERKLADERFRQVVEVSPTGLLIAQKDGRIHLVNEQVERDFGYSRQELLGQPIERLIVHRLHGRPLTTQGGFFAEAASNVLTDNHEVIGVCKDGREIPLEVCFSSIGSERGADILVSIANISERKRAELDIAQQRNELAHLSRAIMLSELSGSFAHELNQPLMAILSNAQAALRFLTQEQPDLVEIREILQDIVNDDKRAGEVIQGMRLLLKKGELKSEPLAPNTLVLEVLRLLRSDMLNAGVICTAELAEDLPQINGIRVQLQQVLLNLMTNACDAMADVPKHHRRLVISTLRDDSDCVTFCVRDAGLGVSAEQTEKVFEPFYTTKKHGLGLGLAVCRRIVNAQGGRIWAENNMGGGARFCFTVPIDKKDIAWTGSNPK